MPSTLKAKITGHKWRVDSIWNDALLTIPERPLIKRDYVWASEIGGSPIDRILKMNAHPMTNPPNPRSLRKFSAGHIWEWILGVVLTSSGMLKKRQLKCDVELPGLLRATGKLDFIAGGVVDWDLARHNAELLRSFFSTSISDMPPIVMHSIDKIITSMQHKYGNNPLEESVLEGKSVSSFMSEKLKKTKRPLDHNVLQLAHYIIPNKLPGKLLYICKDDCIMQEFEVDQSPGLLKLYKNDLAKITEYYKGCGKNYLKNLPPRESEILFDADMHRFSMNFRVEYSPYLTMLYEYKTPELYRLKWQSQITAWNRVFKRVATKQRITDSNRGYMNQMKKYFPDWEKYMLKAQKIGFFEKDEEGGEDE
jgi:hypothetical protein